MGNIAVELTEKERLTVWAALAYFAKDYEVAMDEYEKERGQDNGWQEIRNRREYFQNLANKFKKEN